ncbi:DUF3995 domain-containing protein [Niabella sp. 22666]|uniref:DUF3995 domain-containing protein n=1 Tax=Niabella sp. 22666 TaxID=3453954 RepID=UPI003F87A86D
MILYIWSMPFQFLILANVSVFVLLALLHFYWAFGGKWAFDHVIPTDSNGKKLFHPSSLGTLVVAICLMACAWINLACFNWTGNVTNPNYLRYGIRAIGIIFLLRALGDFRYIGYSKRYRTSGFAIKDTLFFSPLCFFLGLSHLIVGGSGF